MAVTIVDVAQASEDLLEKGVLMQVLRASDVIGVLPWLTRNTLRVRGTKWQNLPTAGFRNFNAGYDEDTGDLEQWDDGLFPFGGDIYIEKQFLGLEEMIEPPDVTQARMKLKALAMEFNYYFIEGTPALGGFIGLRHRIENDLPARCTIWTNGGGGAVEFPIYNSAANTHHMLDCCHQANKIVGGANAIFMNETSYLGFSSMLRRQGLLDVTRDVFDREVLSFMGARLVDVGLRADQATEIITDTEDPGDGGADSSSMYFVRLGPASSGDPTIVEGDGLHGIQKESLKSYDPLNGGEMEARPAYIRRIDWPVSISTLGDDYAVCRVRAFEFAA